MAGRGPRLHPLALQAGEGEVTDLVLGVTSGRVSTAEATVFLERKSRPRRTWRRGHHAVGRPGSPRAPIGVLHPRGVNGALGCLVQHPAA